MASPAVTYTFTNSTVADADEVNTNFADIINSLTDGTKDLSISALTAAGAATLNGNVTLGNASSDDITFTGSLSSTIPIKTTNSYNIGSSTIGLAGVYFGNAGGSTTIRDVSAASVSSSLTFTKPDVGANADYVMSAGAQTIGGVKTFTDGINLGDDNLTVHKTASGSITTAVAGITIDTANDDWVATRTGNQVTIKFKLKWDWTSSLADSSPAFSFAGLPSDFYPTTDEVSFQVLTNNTQDGVYLLSSMFLQTGTTFIIYRNAALAGFNTGISGTFSTGHVSLSNYYVQFTYTVQ